MSNETMVTVAGNIASDVTNKRVGVDEVMVASFRVASSERKWDRATDTWSDGPRFSAKVSCWRRLGEEVVAALVKGDPVVVQGKLSVREYEAGGERRYSTEITATSVGPDLAKCGAVVKRRRPAAAEGDGEGDLARAVDAAVPSALMGLAGELPPEPAELVGMADDDPFGELPASA